MKSLNSKQTWWTQKLSKYYFQIDYCKDKVDGAANILLQYSQRSVEEEKTLQAKNIKILY